MYMFVYISTFFFSSNFISQHQCYDAMREENVVVVREVEDEDRILYVKGKKKKNSQKYFTYLQCISWHLHRHTIDKRKFKDKENNLDSNLAANIAEPFFSKFQIKKKKKEKKRRKEKFRNYLQSTKLLLFVEFFFYSPRLFLL